MFGACLAMRLSRCHFNPYALDSFRLRGSWLPCLLGVLLLPVAAIPVRGLELPAGTNLEIRLNTATGSRLSHRGDGVEATVIAPVMDGSHILVPQGSTLSGHVATVHRLGFGIKHPTASILLEFEWLTLPGQAPVPMATRVMEVETARERVNGSGTIGGIHPVANFSSGVSIFISALMTQPALAVPILAGKFLIARSPDPEIYFPPGTEMIVQVNREQNLPALTQGGQKLASISAEDSARARELLGSIPEQQSRRGLHDESDLTNVLLLGTHEQIGRAFKAAGWAGSQGRNAIALYHIYNCLVMRFGYSMAPMSRLQLNGSRPEAMYQKSLNTFSKRHHIRLWKQDGSDMWLSAASEDLSFSMRMGLVGHASDRNIDNERAKVIDDLALTGCVESASFLPRSNLRLQLVDRQAIVTDGRIAVLRMTDCTHPAHEFPFQQRHAIASRFGHGLAIVSKDFARSNPLTLLVSASNMMIRRADHSQKMQAQPSEPKGQGPGILIPAAWKRPVPIESAAEQVVYTSSAKAPSKRTITAPVPSAP